MSKKINLHRHNMPEWFKSSDFGIFIHWGLYSVPAYAPDLGLTIHDLMKKHSVKYLMKNSPYTEWYLNSLRIKGSSVAEYHKNNYGYMPYEDFAMTFKETAKNANVEEWAESFKAAGAKYVVFVTKHHDGFVMYDTKYKNPRAKDYNLDFDFVGQLAAACRSRGLRFGVYYSSLLDWSFTKTPLTSPSTFLLSNDNSKEYIDYCMNHWKELIDRYKPDILWSDIGYPADRRLPELFEYYYRQAPEGVVNDRWHQFPNILRFRIFWGIFDIVGNFISKRFHDTDLPVKYYDYKTTEYTSEFNQKDIYWEMCRGIDQSFAYNRNSRPDNFMTAEEVITLINDVKGRKGRLLLNVGPDENGQIPENQNNVLKRLAELR